MCFIIADIPNTTVPPLTPGTNQKMSQALVESFKSFGNEQRRLGIPKGECSFTFTSWYIFHFYSEAIF